MSNKQHWQTVYATKTPQEVSWTQAIPHTSIDMIAHFQLPTHASIIDIGGGDSHLVDNLLALGYTNITVLDISGNALERAQKRLGTKAESVTWIEADITQWQPTTTYHLWHDRAVFHFLTTAEDIATYQNLVAKHVQTALVMATFSTEGPLKCSGLPITQYSVASLQQTFANAFNPEQNKTEEHQTPFDTIQNFVWCSFKKI